MELTRPRQEFEKRPLLARPRVRGLAAIGEGRLMPAREMFESVVCIKPLAGLARIEGEDQRW
jgi:hypothetical protein